MRKMLYPILVSLETAKLHAQEDLRQLRAQFGEVDGLYPGEIKARRKQLELAEFDADQLLGQIEEVIHTVRAEMEEAEYAE